MDEVEEDMASRNARETSAATEVEPLPPTMFERLVTAIHTAKNSAPYPWWHMDADHCQVSPWIARAVLEAMREPTAPMVQTACPSHTPGEQMPGIGGRVWGECPKHLNAAFRWRAMIDAALADAREHSSPRQVIACVPGCNGKLNETK